MESDLKRIVWFTYAAVAVAAGMLGVTLYLDRWDLSHWWMAHRSIPPWDGSLVVAGVILTAVFGTLLWLHQQVNRGLVDARKL